MMMRRIATKEIMAAIPRSELMMMRERILNWETATPRKNQDEKIRTQKHQFFFQEFFGVGALSHFVRFANVGVNHSAILPYLRANQTWKLVYNHMKIGIPRHQYSILLS